FSSERFGRSVGLVALTFMASARLPVVIIGNAPWRSGVPRELPCPGTVPVQATLHLFLEASRAGQQGSSDRGPEGRVRARNTGSRHDAHASQPAGRLSGVEGTNPAARHRDRRAAQAPRGLSGPVQRATVRIARPRPEADGQPAI